MNEQFSFRMFARGVMLMLPLTMLFGCQSGPAQTEKVIESYLEKHGLDFLDKNLTALVERREEEGRLKEQESILEAYRKRVEGALVQSTPLAGAKDGELEVILFGNFQDPYTKISYKILRELIEKDFRQTAKLGFRHLPNAKFEHSRTAAAAAEAAKKQGKFWEMADLLFETQDNLKDGNLQNAAKSLGLDMAQFNQDRKSIETKTVISDDEKFAKKHGAIVTPTYFVNGAAFYGARKERRMRHILKTLLMVLKGEIKVSERYE